MIGASAFGVASVLAAFSVTAGMLIAARALLGIARRHLDAFDPGLDQEHVHRPASAPSGAADVARESITAAIAAAAQLPDQIAGDLLAAARDAFVDGLNLVAAVSAVLFLGLAVLAARLFRHVPARRDAEQDLEGVGEGPADAEGELAASRTAAPAALAKVRDYDAIGR